ncbi:MAG: 50S ribosomal protein L17 [Spirochaetaceae bacterium]|jgi:large subunit ribosomal protein L17|nr:50S ribosomal protein L17 [Spirochaetaceae bacterium]
MKHKRGFNPLERMAAHRKALIRNMAGSLFRYGRITTTKAKACEVRRRAEKLITRAKVDSVHNRRLVSARLYDEGIVAKLFTDIAPRMKERPGGYTRIVKLGERKGDAAEMVILELVDYVLVTDTKDDKDGKKKAEKEKGK